MRVQFSTAVSVRTGDLALTPEIADSIGKDLRPEKYKTYLEQLGIVYPNLP